MTEVHRIHPDEIAIREQLMDYQYFTSGEQLEEYLQSLGLGKEAPKLILWRYVMNDAQNFKSDEPRLVVQERTVGHLLENLADYGAGLADESNDFTAGLVLGLDDGTHLAIRYRSEEYALDPAGIRLTEHEEQSLDGFPERELGYDKEFEVAICRDYTALLWGHRTLIEY